MKTIRLVPTLVTILLIVGLAQVAFAQAELPEPGFDPRLWFGSAAALAGTIVAIVSLLKTHVLKSLTGLGTVAVSFGLGVGLAVVGSLIPAVGYEATIVEAATFGVSAAALASGGWDAVTGALGSVLGSKS